MSKLITMMVFVAMLMSAFAAVEVNVWTGNGGDFRWANMANWEKQGGGDPINPSSSSNTTAPSWDFSALPANSTVVNDYEGTLWIGGLTFASKQGTITFTSTKDSTVCGFVKSNASPWINPSVNVPSGTTVDFQARQDSGGNVSSVSFKGGGTFKINGYFVMEGAAKFQICDATLVFGASCPANATTANLNVFFEKKDAVLSLETDRTIGCLKTAAGMSAKPKLCLNSHALTVIKPLDDDKHHGVTNFAEIVTGGTITYRGNNVNYLTGGFVAGCTPMTFAMDNADLDVGSADSPISVPAGSAFVGNRNGRLGLYADQSFASVKSDSSAGGLSIAKDKTLIVTGAANATETLRAPIVGGGKVAVQAPDSYELKLTGANAFAQNLRIESGKVSVMRPYREGEGLVAYWNFDDDVTGQGPRSIATGKAPVTEPYKDTTFPTYDLTGAGGFGKCAHFDYTGDTPETRKVHSFAAKNFDAQRLGAMTNDHTVVLYIRPDGTTMDVEHRGNNVIMEVFYNDWAETAKGRGMLAIEFYTKTHLNLGGLNGLTNSRDVNLETLGIDCFDGNWHQVAVTYSRTAKRHRAYLDGAKVGEWVETTDYAFLINADPPIRYGARTTWPLTSKDKTYHGDMDNLQLWSRELSAEEVAEDWRKLGNLSGGSAFGKTAPIAHWTFDDPDALGADATGRGHDLAAVTEGDAVEARDGDVCTGVNGSAARIPLLNGSKKGSHFVGDIPSELTPSGSFSLTMRIQPLGANVEENRNAAVFLGGADDKTYLELHLRDWSPYVESTVFGNAFRENLHRVAQSLVDEKTPRSGWMDFAYVYDQPNKTMMIYRDGVLVSTMTKLTISSFGTNPKLYVGYSPIRPGWFPEYVDDLRLYDRALTDAEVSEIVRELSNAGAATDEVLPQTASVSLVGTGVLDLLANQTIDSLWGKSQGTLNLPYSDLTVNSFSQFGGVLAGRGTVYAKDDFELSGSGPAFYGKVVAEKTLKVNDRFANAIFAYADGAQLTVKGDETAPLVSSGTIEIPATGALTVTGTRYAEDRKIVIARGTKVVAPEGIEGWTATLSDGRTGKFYLTETEFGCKMPGGMLLIVR